LGAIGIPDASAVADEEYYLTQIRVEKLSRLRRGWKFFSADFNWRLCLRYRQISDFPLFGGVSVLLAGFISDKVGRNGRALIILIGLLLSSGGLWLLGHARFGGSPALPVLLVAAVAFTLIGPYSYLAGAISLDFGGKQGAATTSGVIDGVGYLGGVLAGDTVARVSVSFSCKARSLRWPWSRCYQAWPRRYS
jgi:sugar phosphate permease